MNTAPAPADETYADIFADADVPVETHPDCADIFAVQARPGEPVDPDVADIIEDWDPAPSVER